MAEDCFDLAARYHHVNADILRSIAIRESTDCSSRIGRNRDGTLDWGCMQINDRHLPELARYGISAADLMDQCKNIFVGAWHYAKKVRRYGNTWTAVGAYHNERPGERDRYAREVYAIWRRYFSVGSQG